MRLETFDRIQRLATAYVRLHRLVEAQSSRSVVMLGGRRRMSERAPVNLSALDLAGEIEARVTELLEAARRLGAGVDVYERVPRPISVSEAGRRLGVSSSRVWRLIRIGRLEAFRVNGRTVVMDTDVAEFQEARSS
jgi:excisionase family DNA binding protein